MSSVFICHASEDKPVVEPIALALVNAGCRVFYDEQSLPAGGDYQGRIEAAIADCDVFVFIASAVSTAPERFTLSELKFARQRWPSPVDRVLPVAIGGISAAALPPYLQAVTIFTASGNVAAEVRNEVEGMLRRQRGKGRRWVPAAVLGVAVLGVGGFAYQRMASSPVTPVGSAPREQPTPVDRVDPRPAPPPSPASGPIYVNAMQEAQLLLKDLGYIVHRTDGVAGANTVSYIETFQRKNQLPVTGVPDETTLEAMRRKAATRRPGS